MQKSLVKDLFWYFSNEKNQSYYDISTMYNHLFKIFDEESLEEFLLNFYENVYLENKDEQVWFPYFHKMFRQLDVYENCYREGDNHNFESITGHLDMIFHTFVYFDNNYLCTILKFIFEEYETNQ